MHYANNREAKIGDAVVGLKNNQKGTVGIVVDALPDSSACNLTIATYAIYPDSARTNTWLGNIAGLMADNSVISISQICGTASEFIHAEDAANYYNALTSAMDGTLPKTFPDESSDGRSDSQPGEILEGTPGQLVD